MKSLTMQLGDERRLVSFDNYDLSIRELMSMFEDGQLIIPPAYQRQFVWSDLRQSMLVESLFLGIPIPNIFLATNPDANWEVVDGVQRLCSLFRFIGKREVLDIIGSSNCLAVQGLEKLTSLNKKTYNDIERNNQMAFLTRPVRITVLNDKSDVNVRFDLFERLNTGGVSLTQQEIRNCVFRGKFNEELKELSSYSKFTKSITLKPIDKRNGTQEELVLRFFAFLNNYNNFEHSVKGFLNEYMKENANKSIKKEHKGLFNKTFDFIDSELTNGICRGGRRITPTNLFEAISVGTALSFQRNGITRKGVLASIIDSAELKKMTTGATNSKKMVTGRINFVRDALQ